MVQYMADKRGRLLGKDARVTSPAPLLPPPHHASWPGGRQGGQENQGTVCLYTGPNDHGVGLVIDHGVCLGPCD